MPLLGFQDWLLARDLRRHPLTIKWRTAARLFSASKTQVCANGFVLCLQLVTRTKKIFVGGLSASTTEDDVRAFFEAFGKVKWNLSKTFSTSWSWCRLLIRRNQQWSELIKKVLEKHPFELDFFEIKCCQNSEFFWSFFKVFKPSQNTSYSVWSHEALIRTNAIHSQR